MDIIVILSAVIIVVVFCSISQLRSQFNHFETVGNDDVLVTQLPIHVINLKSRPDRKERTINTLNHHGLTANYIEAVNGQELNLAELVNKKIVSYNPGLKRYLRRGEIGCSMSHIKAWELIKDSGSQYGLIFEDDIKLVPDFRHKLNAVMHATHNLDWDIIYLGRTCYYNSDYWHNRKCIDGTSIIAHLIYPELLGYGNFAYIIKASAIDKIMPYMYPLKSPIDVIIPNLYKQGLIKAVGLKRDIVAVVGNTDSDTYRIK